MIKKSYLILAVFLSSLFIMPLVESTKPPISWFQTEGIICIDTNQTEHEFHHFGQICPDSMDVFDDNLSEVIVSLELIIPLETHPLGTEDFWSGKVSPNEIRISKNSRQYIYFNLTLNIKEGYPKQLYSAERIYDFIINVSTRSLYNNGTEENHFSLYSFYATMSFYSDLSVTPIHFSDYANKGDSLIYNLTIINLGNSYNILSISIEDENKLKNKGISFDFPRKIELGYNQSKYINVRANISENAQANDYQIKIIIRPRTSWIDSEEQIILELIIKDESWTILHGIYLGIVTIFILILAGIIYIMKKSKEKSE